MFGPTRYLDWARRFYGQVAFDLATSGTPGIALADLGPLPPLDDDAALGRLTAKIARHNDAPEDACAPALGTSHAIWLAYAALASPGDEVLVEDPAYEPLVRTAEGMGLGVRRFTRDAARNFALDPERVAAAITPRTRAVVVTNLHNPTGVRAADAEIVEVARIAEARGAHLVVDEVYAPFDDMVDAGGVFRGSARRLAPNVVVLGSLTKCYGVGPLRAGWLVGPPDIAARARQALTSNVGVLPTAHAVLAGAAFDRVAALADRSRALLAGKRERVGRWVAARQDLTWSAPTSGLFGFATSARAGDLTTTLELAAREHGVLVAPGAFFGVPNGFRLAWSIAADRLDDGLARLARALPGGATR